MFVNALRRLRIIARLALLAVIALVIMGAIIFESMDSLHAVLQEEREESTRQLVEVAVGTLEHFHAQQQAGALSEDDARKQAIEAIRRLRYNGSEYFWIQDRARPVPRMVMHPTQPTLEGKALDDPRFDKAISLREGIDGSEIELGDRNVFVTAGEVAERAGHGFVSYDWPKSASDNEPQLKTAYVKQFQPWGWVVASGTHVDDARAKFSEHAIHLSTLAGAGTLLLLALALLIRRSLLAEFGGEPDDATRITTRIAEGDLSGRIELRTGDQDSVLFVLDRMQNNLRTMIRDMIVNARKVENNIERLSSESNEINLATQLQASAIDQTRSAIADVSVSVDVVTSLARDTETSSGDVVRHAQRGAAAAEEVASEMQAIAATVANSSFEVTRLVERTHEIDRMALVIREIADQTNLLALNAAIEAARAGEQGRGFAVVADEVRKLAERTGQATAEITNVLHGIQTDTERAVAGMNAAAPVIATGVEKANQTASTLRAIEAQSQVTLGKMSELARATQAQTDRIGEIVHNVNDVLEASGQTEAVIQNSLETATVLESAANELFRMVQRFDLGESADIGVDRGTSRTAKALLQWTDRLSVGHRDIDRQHQRLIDIANKLNAAMHQGQGRDVAGAILNELVDYTVSHFEFEEQLMKRHGYRHEAHHVAEHRKLLDDVGTFKTSFEKGNASISIELMGFIRDWLLNHILKVDKALARELAALKTR